MSDISRDLPDTHQPLESVTVPQKEPAPLLHRRDVLAATAAGIGIGVWEGTRWLFGLNSTEKLPPLQETLNLISGYCDRIQNLIDEAKDIENLADPRIMDLNEAFFLARIVKYTLLDAAYHRGWSPQPNPSLIEKVPQGLQQAKSIIQHVASPLYKTATSDELLRHVQRADELIKQADALLKPLEEKKKAHERRQ